ncbi:MAG: hypothetical protein JNK48_17070 [Bryobacterales bacterium]|nr:hypothetical protein [Bryobacterales bacterium]
MRGFVFLLAIASSCYAQQEYSFAGKTFRSSSQLKATWTAHPDAHFYKVTATDGRHSVTLPIPREETSALLTELKSATAYTIAVEACIEETCTPIQESQQTTEAEYWRIAGDGNSFRTAKRLTSDANVNASALRYGDWAGTDLSGKVQLYYVPLQADEKGMKIGEQLATGNFTEFRPVSGFGLMRVCGAPGTTCPTTPNLSAQLALFQPVPMTNGTVRLFFEAQATDGRTRVLSLDSQDGYIARDFHRGPATRCSTFADFAPGGPCEPAIVIGVDIDAAQSNPNLLNARQFKVAWPNRDGRAWDGAPGAFLLFTTEYRDGRCSTAGFNFGYAIYDGERWQVQYNDDGCPRLMKGMQAMAPMHLGGNRYKMYFNQHPDSPQPPGPARKPIRLLYNDSPTDAVAFEDWEPKASSRPVHFLFNDGTPLTEDEISRLDDNFAYMPTGDWQLQVLYSNMSAVQANNTPPFIGTSILINP